MSKIIYKNLLSPLGLSLEDNFRQICNGKSALQPASYDWLPQETYTSVIDNDEIDEAFRLQGPPDRYTKLEKLSILLINDLLEKTEIDAGAEDTLLIFSTTKGNIELMYADNKQIPKDRIQPSSFAEVIRSFFNFQHTPVIVSNACVSGVQAMLLADTLLRADAYKNVLVVGGDMVGRFTLSGFSAIRALSSQRCLPFDRDRKGINLGECCVGVVMTNEEGAVGAEIVTGASTVDAHHIVAPSRTASGLTAAIKKCLEHGGGADIGFVSAHGTATKYNDEMEALALNNNQLSHLPLFSLKGYYGHTLGAAGILEAVIALSCLENNCLIPSKGYAQSGVSYPINVLRSLEKRNCKGFLKTASGFGGVNAAMIIRRA
ncbi:MAG: beta-ketoacyl synthase N-terminal-like domain-containing protein [Bacteroidota bacterium]